MKKIVIRAGFVLAVAAATTTAFVSAQAETGAGGISQATRQSCC